MTSKNIELLRPILQAVVARWPAEGDDTTIIVVPRNLWTAITLDDVDSALEEMQATFWTALTTQDTPRTKQITVGLLEQPLLHQEIERLCSSLSTSEELQRLLSRVQGSPYEGLVEARLQTVTPEAP